MKIDQLRGKKILIIGYGVEGQATERFLRAKISNVVIGITDQKSGPDYLKNQKDYDIAVRSPGVKPGSITIPYTTATNIFFANVNAVTVGVTGSKGKSTTASLIHHILTLSGKKSHLVGNIGNPMLSEVLKPYTKDDIFVCELSSYQIQDLQYSPHIAVITSLFPEHMNYHGNVDDYYSAKRQIIRSLKSDDYFIYNPKYENLNSWAQNVLCKVIKINPDFHLENLKLLGSHNQDNVKLAAAAAQALGVSEELVLSAVSSFKPLSHRLEYVGTFQNITFYDDSISTAPESTIAAIEALPSIGTLILGGEDRGYDFTNLVDSILHHKIPALVLFPSSGSKIEEILKKKTNKLPAILQTSSMEEAIRFAYQHSPKGSICLLSSASPSYSLWKNFEEKGTEFQSWVKQLKSVKIG